MSASTDELLSGLPTWALLPRISANGQLPFWNNTTKKWEAGDAPSGFNPDAAYTFNNSVLFNQVPQYLGINLATVQDLTSALAPYSTTTQMNDAISASYNMILAGAPAGYDTLLEISNYIATDTTGAAAINNAIAARLLITDVIDNVTSTNTNKALSANQGKLLNDALSGKANVSTTNVFSQNNTFQANVSVGHASIQTDRFAAKSDGTNRIGRFSNSAGTIFMDIDTNARVLTITEGSTVTTLQQISGNTSLFNNSNSNFNIQTGVGGNISAVLLSAGGVDLRINNVSQLLVDNSGYVTLKSRLRWGSNSSTPMLIANGAQLDVKLADNSAYTYIRGFFRFEQMPTSEVRSNTHYLTVKLQDGTDFLLHGSLGG
ncbi:MAG: hypothetical protein V4538_01835 [Bacteroidota bacterium]